MNVFTSYYAKCRKLGQLNYAFVSISNTNPPWFDGRLIDWSKYAPDWATISDYRKGLISEEEFKIRYLKRLDSLFDKEVVLNDLEQLLQRYEGVVFLCYEGPGKLCHRYFFAEWLGNGIEEL